MLVARMVVLIYKTKHHKRVPKSSPISL